MVFSDQFIQLELLCEDGIL